MLGRDAGADHERGEERRANVLGEQTSPQRLTHRLSPQRTCDSMVLILISPGGGCRRTRRTAHGPYFVGNRLGVVSDALDADVHAVSGCSEHRERAAWV